MMQRTRIDSELVEKVSRLKNEERLSNQKIADRLGCNQRTVAKCLRKAKEKGLETRRSSALTSGYADALKDHYRNLVVTSQALGECVKIDPLNASQANSADLLDHYLEQQLLANGSRLAERGVNLDPNLGQSTVSWIPYPSLTYEEYQHDPEARRLARRLRDVLYQHDRTLEDHVKEWMHKWDELPRHRRSLWEETPKFFEEDFKKYLKQQSDTSTTDKPEDKNPQQSEPSTTDESESTSDKELICKYVVDTAIALEAMKTLKAPGEDLPDEAFTALLDEVFSSAKSCLVTFPNPYTGGESSSTIYLAYKE